MPFTALVRPGRAVLLPLRPMLSLPVLFVLVARLALAGGAGAGGGLGTPAGSMGWGRGQLPLSPLLGRKCGTRGAVDWRLLIGT